MARKHLRKNYYKNSAARRRAEKIAHIISVLKIAAGLFFVAIMSFAFIFGYDLLTQSRYFTAAYLNVQGCNMLKEKDVIVQAKLSPGRNIFSVNLAMTRKRLLAHPWISEAEVSREIPSGLSIRIKEHEPLAIIDINRKFLMNRQGEIFKEWDVTDPIDLPMVYGLEFSDLNVGDKSYSRSFSAVMSVLRLGQKDSSVVMNREINEIFVDKDIGLTLYANNSLGTIKLGFDDYPIKFRKLKDVLFYLKRNRLTAGFNSIDLNNPKRIVVNLNSEESPMGHKEV